jgi:hypothetical protein
MVDASSLFGDRMISRREEEEIKQKVTEVTKFFGFPNRPPESFEESSFSLISLAKTLFGDGGASSREPGV